MGESGTLARLSTALLALASRAGERWTIQAHGTLLFRRSLPLFTALHQAGVRFERKNLPGTWPVEFVSVAPPTRLSLRHPVSSQEVSALLVALAAHARAGELLVEGPLPSRPYVRMTETLLRAFGAEVAATPSGFAVRGPMRAPSASLTIEPDASSAAVALAAACLTGGELIVNDLGSSSSQGDVRIIEHLCAFGCEASASPIALQARGFPRHGAELDLADEPDLAPVLCAIAFGAARRAGARSRLRGLGTLPGKESDRLTGLARGLEALGAAVATGADWIEIRPGTSPSKEPVLLDPRGDHRMVFTFALCGLVRDGVRVRDAQASVAKSWRTFWSDLERLGAQLTRG